MKIVDIGVLENSFMDFLDPSPFAESSLYYITQFGHFFCNDRYMIRRNFLDLFLLIYVCDGELEVVSNGRKVSVHKDQIVIIDCRSPHHYYCRSSVEFLWFHYNGCSSASYYDYLTAHSSLLHTGDHIAPLKNNFKFIHSAARHIHPNEHDLSLNIHSILGHLATPASQTRKYDDALNPAFASLHKDYASELTLDALAESCSMSTSHFIRTFKRFMDCTPHEYLLSYRLRQAKQMLLTSGNTIESIAEACGFNSASHFSRAFRKANSLTPSEFRNMHI